MGLFREKIAIDLGTAYSIVAHATSENLWRIPSSVAIELSSRHPVAYGEKAKDMQGKGSANFEVIRPLRDGVICDFEAAGHYLSYLVGRARRNPLALRYSLLVCVPWGATAVETRSYVERVRGLRTGIRLIREPFAAALGCGQDIFSSEGCTVVDLGGGTVEISTIAYGHMIACSSVRQAGNAMDQIIVERMLRSKLFEIALNTAEEIKMGYGSVWKDTNRLEETFDVFGLDRRTGTPRRTTLTTEELREFLEPLIETIEQNLAQHLKLVPPEFQTTIAEKGIQLVGGGALLRGWKQRLESRLHIKVNIPPEPQFAVIHGMQEILRHGRKYEPILKISEALGQTTQSC